MYDEARVQHVLDLVSQGHNLSAISRQTGINRSTIRSWVSEKRPESTRRPCPLDDWVYLASKRRDYVYLLGLYLGDGCITIYKNKTPKLRIVCCATYPQLIQRCDDAMSAVMPNKVTRIHHQGCSELTSSSKHWPCLIPQHGPGRKHERKIELASWQRELIDIDPWPLIEGLIHSDGCRVLNWVNGTAYPRYHFCNASSDIRNIFMNACTAVGVDCRPNNARNLSVARRKSVALMDAHIAPKR